MGNGGGADMRSNRVFLAAAVGLLPFAWGWVQPAHAQAPDYPSGKITFIVGFAPGGGIDTYARVIAQGLGERLGWSVVIENRPGAASNIAAKAVAAAPPDGYTIMFTGNSYAINQTFYKNPGYATADLRPVAFVAIDSQGLAVSAANPARTLPEFLHGGSSARIVAEYVFLVLAKANATGVPFQSGAPALNALLSNHVDIRRRWSPSSIRRSSRGRPGCWRSPVRGGPRRCPTSRPWTSSACPVSPSMAGSACSRPPGPRPRSVPA
jgi:tripartite-type tricarboxylate transporter receptor subunit TctC